MTARFLEALATLDPLPAWVSERAARVDRITAETPEGFVLDGTRVLAAAYGYMGRLISTGNVPEEGDRDEHIHAFLAKMHGLGTTEERAHALYDEFLQQSGGAAPEGWPSDEKSWAKIRRIWANEHGTYSEAGSELSALALVDVVADIAPDDRLPEDRLWNIEDLVSRPPIRYWDAEQLFPRVNGGYVGVWFGKYGHHKTNFMLSKLRLLLETTDARVLYLMGEGIGGMGARLAAQLDYADRAMIEFRGRFKAYRVPHMADQNDINATLALCNADGFAPDIVVVDTLATALSGLDEDNKTASMLNSNGPVGNIARTLGCLLILIGHEGEKAGKLRGGSGFYGNVDYVVYIKATGSVALTATTEGPEGKIRDGEPVRVWYAIEYHRGVPIPVPTSAAGYDLLTGEAKWEGNEAGSRIAAVLTRVAAPLSSYGLVMELYPREDMDPEDWQARCSTLARKLERAARSIQPLAHLYTDAGALVWAVRPSEKRVDEHGQN